MAIGETWITMVGQLTSEPVHRTAPDSGHDLVTFWLRSTERRFDRKQGEWVDGRELNVRVTCWRKLAAGVHTCLGEGDPVVVTGRLSSHDFEAEGVSRSIPELEAFSVGPNLARCVADLRRPVRAPVARPEWRAAATAGNGLVTVAEPASAA